MDLAESLYHYNSQKEFSTIMKGLKVAYDCETLAPNIAIQKMPKASPKQEKAINIYWTCMQKNPRIKAGYKLGAGPSTEDQIWGQTATSNRNFFVTVNRALITSEPEYSEFMIEITKIFSEYKPEPCFNPKFDTP